MAFLIIVMIVVIVIASWRTAQKEEQKEGTGNQKSVGPKRVSREELAAAIKSSKAFAHVMETIDIASSSRICDLIISMSNRDGQDYATSCHQGVEITITFKNLFKDSFALRMLEKDDYLRHYMFLDMNIPTTSIFFKPKLEGKVVGTDLEFWTYANPEDMPYGGNRRYMAQDFMFCITDEIAIRGAEKRYRTETICHTPTLQTLWLKPC